MSDQIGDDRDARLARLQDELSQCWEAGDCVSVETFLERHAWLRADPAAALELVYHEVLARQDRGEAPRLADFAARFPDHASALTRFFAIQDMAQPATPSPSPGPADDQPPPPSLTGETHRSDAADTHRDDRPSAAEPAPLPPAPPGYELLAEIGRGGMGVVYRARQRNLNRIVALKMILAGPHADAAALARFRAEAEAVARLQHPHIVQVFELGDLDGRPFLAMEYVAGGSLAARVAGAPQPPREAAPLVERLARAMHAVHLQGIVHRDLKPANVLLVSDASVPISAAVSKIADFGLAKLVDAEGDAATASRELLGTPLYMAPEQAAGQSKDVGPPVDIYALGGTLYVLLTGQPPFKGTTLLDLLTQIQNNDPVPPRRLVPTVPTDLDTICLKCLQKDPRKRYATAEALADDLGRFLADRPIQARPISWRERAAKWARREPRLAALIVLVSVVTLAGLATTFGLWRVAERRAEARQGRATEQQLCFFRIGLADRELQAGRPAWALEQLERCPPDLRQWEWHYLRRQCDGREAVKVYAGHAGGVSSGAFSPDGKLVATSSGDGLVRLWGADTTTPVRELRGHEGSISWVAFSSRGDRLASAGEDGRVVAWNADTGKREFVFAEHTTPVSCVLFAPDDKELASAAFNQGAGPADILIWNAATGVVRLTLRGHTQRITNLAYTSGGKRLFSTSHDSTVRVWDTASGETLREFAEHSFAVSGVALSRDGKLVASAAGPLQADRPTEGEILVWEPSTGQIKHRLTGHRGRPVALAFTPDGRRLATAGWDKEIKLWDVATGQEVLSLRGHADGVMSLCFDRTGERLASASVDRTLRIWFGGREAGGVSPP